MSKCNFFMYDVTKWKNMVVSLVRNGHIHWNKKNVKEMTESFKYLNSCLTDTERQVMKELTNLDWSDRHIKSELFDGYLAECQKDKSLYYPVIQLTVMLNCIYAYALAQKYIPSMRERQLYEFSVKSIYQRMHRLSSEEELNSFYADQTIKKRLLIPIAKSEITTFEQNIIEGSFYYIKYFFIDFEGEKHQTNSKSEREKKINTYVISYVNDIQGASYFKETNLHRDLQMLNDMFKNVSKL